MIIALFTLVLLVVGIKTCGDFYWRDYDGVIPTDAIPAGEYSNGTSYIGQAYIHKYGLLLGRINPGDSIIDIPCYGVQKAVIMKILCAPDKRKYYWLRTSNISYAEDTSGKCPVVGGHDQKRAPGTLHIGRTRKHDGVIIGYIGAYKVPNPLFYYPLDKVEITASEYEVLMYSDNPLLPSQQNNIFTMPCLS